jgi:DNA polymerase theta
MLKQVLADRDAKAMLVLPYVALVQEKVRWLRNIVQDISREALGQGCKDDTKIWARRPDKDIIRVVGFFGGGKVRATWHDFDIGVCTIEKVSRLSHLVKLNLTYSSGECPGQRRD